MNPAPQTPTLLHHRSPDRGHARGFTLIELMTVVVIIGIFAAIALPSVVNQLRERKSANVAQQITQFYRTARMRAAGRGSAVLVRYDSNATGGVMMREAIAGAVSGSTCQLSPIASCTTPANRWDDSNLNLLFKQLDQVNPFNNAAGTEYELTRMQMYVANNTAAAKLDVCFTPGGRAFYRQDLSGVFQTMDFVPSLKVWTQKGSAPIGPDRWVYVLPNGIARVNL